MTLIRLGQLQEDSQDFVTAVRKIRKFQKSDYKKIMCRDFIDGIIEKAEKVW